MSNDDGKHWMRRLGLSHRGRKFVGLINKLFAGIGQVVPPVQAQSYQDKGCEQLERRGEAAPAAPQIVGNNKVRLLCWAVDALLLMLMPVQLVRRLLLGLS